MPQPETHICFYGTLRSESREFHLLGLNECLEFVGECTLPGHLYFVADDRLDDFYPAFIPGDEATARGQLYRVTDAALFADALVNLDKYEEYHPDRPDESFYIRATVRLAAPDIAAMVYVYNRPVDETGLIAHGCWAGFMSERGLTRSTRTLEILTGIRDRTS